MFENTFLFGFVVSMLFGGYKCNCDIKLKQDLKRKKMTKTPK